MSRRETTLGFGLSSLEDMILVLGRMLQDRAVESKESDRTGCRSHRQRSTWIDKHLEALNPSTPEPDPVPIAACTRPAIGSPGGTGRSPCCKARAPWSWVARHLAEPGSGHTSEEASEREEKEESSEQRVQRGKHRLAGGRSAVPPPPFVQFTRSG